MPRPFYRSELIGARLVWLLDLTFAGKVWRFASESVEVLTDDGESLAYVGAFEAPSVREVVDVPGSTPGVADASFEIRWPEDVALLMAKGHRLRGGKADLSLWIEGTTYEHRQRIIKAGRISAPQWGEAGEPVGLTVAAKPYEDRSTFPPAAATVNEITWPSRGAKADGLAYPWVFGAPGVTTESDGTTAYLRGSPAIWVNTDTLLIAGHEVDAATVRIYNASTEADSGFNVTTTTDALGRTVSTVDISGWTAANRDEDHEYWVDWRGGGGALKDDRSGAIESPAEVLIYMLRQSLIEVDRARLVAALAAVDGWKLAGYVDDVVSPWEWIASNVLPILPISLSAGPDGLFAVPWRIGARSIASAESVTVGPGFARVSPVTEEDGDLVSDLRLRYAVAEGKDPTRTVLVGSSAYDANEPNAFPSVFGMVSSRRYGRQELAVDTDVVCDSPTASAVAASLLRSLAFPPRTVEYEASPEYAWLRPGDVLLVTEAGLYWTDAVGVVTTRAWLKSGNVGFVVTFWEDTARDGVGGL